MTWLTLIRLAAGPLGLLVKITIGLALSGLVATLLLRASAATRHVVWLAGLVASLGLALAWPFAPRLDVRVPVSRAAEAKAVALLPRPKYDFGHVEGRSAQSVGASTAVSRPAQPIRATRVARRGVEIPFGELVLATWLAGILLLGVRMVAAHASVARIVRGARPVGDDWSRAADLVRDTGLQRDVRILISDEIDGPVTAGFVNPVVIVPTSAREWSDERKEIVLTHELAHVARFDFAAQCVASIACALLWFHPLVWIAAARLRAEAEHAADDRVLAGGIAGVTYASHLLDLARVESSTRLSAAVAVGMVRASRLEGRVRAMLDFDRSRAAVSTRAQALATSLTLAAMVPIAGVRAVSMPVRLPMSAPVQQRQLAADSVFEKTIDAKSGEVLTLDLETGGNVTVRGSDEQQVRVRARLSGDDWRDTRVALERWAGGVRLRSDYEGSADRRSTRHAFEIWVPRHMNVDLRSSGGSLAINDLTGEFRGQTGGGSMVIERATGSARLSTGGGNVRVANSELTGTVSTGGGEVLIANVRGGLRASSGSGPVIHVPGIVEGSAISAGVGANATTTTISGIDGRVDSGIGRTASVGGSGYTYDVTSAGVSRSDGRTITSAGSGTRTSTVTASGVTTTINSYENDMMLSGVTSSYTMSKAGGAIEVSEVPNGAQLRTGGGRIYVGSANGFLGVSTGGGDIDLPRVGGSVSASTGAGDVTITVVDAGNPEHSVDVFTGRGQVVLELPSNLDARFELETAYTESRQRTRIDSDFSLQSSETTDWDDSQGTPRKYVRASGIAGSGRGLIRIRVVNGDIIVRRGR